MRVTNKSTLLVLQGVAVVSVAETRLDHEETDHYCSEDGVGLLEELE